ncbi:ABC transporter substrate-binding protein [Thermodesulfobacteriota bacterium]
MMKKNKMIAWFFPIGIFILCIGILLAFPGASMAEPRGKAGYATRGSQGMSGFDIHTGSGAYHTTLTSMLYAKLVLKDKDGRLQPDLAKSWEIGPNYSWVKFHLNENARFTDGKPVTAEDVKFTFERAASRPKYVWGMELKRKLERVEVVDKHTVIIHHKSAYPGLLDRCAGFFGILPKHYIEKVGDEAFAKKPIGAGPFKLVKYKQNVYTDVEANTDHYRKVPNVKYFRYNNVQEPGTRSAMLKTGEIDIAILPTMTFWEVAEDPDIRIVMSKYNYLATLCFYDLRFPEQKSPFHDLRVRKAASMAINRKMICEKVLHGLYIPWGDVLAPYNAGYDPTIKPPAYDLEKAKALLKEAGYPNGFETEITGAPSARLEVQSLAADLSKVGIKVKLNTPEAGTWSKMVRERKFRGIARDSGPWWSGRQHPTTALYSYTHSKSVWCFKGTPEVDKRFEALESLSGKELAVKAKAFSKYYRDQYIRVPLWACNTPYGVRKRIKYWEQTPGYVYAVNFEHLELADD